MSGYDNTCKFLAETFPVDFSNWLLGRAIAFTKLEPSELSLEPIRADSVIFLESAETILHLEFQTRPDELIAFRMSYYWIRLHGKSPNKEIDQVEIYLMLSNSPLVYQTTFSSQKLNHEFNVIRLWEQSTEVLQSYLGLLPLSVLSKTDDPTETLRKTAKIIDNIENRQVKNNVSAATAIISGLALSKDVIQKLLRSDIMKESVIYQDILLEGTVKGKAEGKAEERNQIALKMLRSKMAVDLVAQFTGLSVKQVEKLQKFATEPTKITKPTRAKRSPNA